MHSHDVAGFASLVDGVSDRYRSTAFPSVVVSRNRPKGFCNWARPVRARCQCDRSRLPSAAACSPYFLFTPKRDPDDGSTSYRYNGISSNSWNRAMSRFGPFSAVLAAVVLLAGCSLSRRGKANLAKHKAYQATYSCPGNFAYQSSHLYRDGAGHIRIDISGQGPTVVHVLDQKTNETIAWTEGG